VKRSSISDIAKRLGVSNTLVSMVLNGKAKENRISEETIKRVFEVAKELNYQPNQLARGLRTGKSKTIGLIVADISNPFFSRIGRKIEDEASKYGYHVIFCSSDENTQKTKTLINVLNERQVDGFIISPTAGSQQQIKELLDSDIPVVLIDRYFTELETNYIAIDNYTSSYKIVKSLIVQGYKRIGSLFFNTDMVHMKHRMNGYKDACKEAGIQLDERWIRNVDFENLEESIKKEMKALISPEIDCDSFFFPTGELAVKSLEGLAEDDIHIFNHTGISCFDDPEAFHFSPFPVITLTQPINEIGNKAIDIIMEEIESENEVDSPRKVILDSHILERRYESH